MSDRCALCGLEGHRYGTTDENHKPDAIACVNGLRTLVGEQQIALTKAKVALVAVMSHPLDSCNGDDVRKCFVCEALRWLMRTPVVARNGG